MKVTGHKTRRAFERYDITSEEDLATSRKLQTLTGTIGGTKAGSAAEGEEQLSKSVKGESD